MATAYSVKAKAAIRRAAVVTGIAVVAALIPATANADEPERVIPCGRLEGSGHYSDPTVIGVVDRKTVITGCAPLTGGEDGDPLRYFLFELEDAPSRYAWAGTRYKKGTGLSGVDARLADGPFTLRHSFESVPVRGPVYSGWGHRLNEVGRRGPLRFGAEKLTNRTSRTPRYDVIIVP